MAESIGERIKTLRIEQGMTLAELGEKVNLSTSYLSQIERDKTSPSLTTLESIAKSLNIGLRYFFETDDEATFVVRNSEKAKTSIQKTPVVRQPLMPLMGNPKIEVYRITINSGSPPQQIDQLAGEEVIFVLDGDLTIAIGDEQFTLTAGDSIHYDALLNHSWKNESSASCTILWSRALSLSDYQPSSITKIWNRAQGDGGI